MSKLSDGHWISEHFSQRMTTKDWRQILLARQDVIFVSGEMRQLVAKRLGSGVVEISKKPLTKD